MSVEIERDDGTRLVLSRAEAARVREAEIHVILNETAGALVGRCGGKSSCKTCMDAHAAREARQA